MKAADPEYCTGRIMAIRKEVNHSNNKLNPHMASTPGFEPGQHWWEASALTTTPSLAPRARDGKNTIITPWSLLPESSDN